MVKHTLYKYIIVWFLGLCLVSCSTTRLISPEDKLFIGVDNIHYDKTEDAEHFSQVKEEIEVALASQPNGALFGSSSLRSPFPIGLWIWNTFSNSKGFWGKWITKSFGKKPILLKNINPALRSSVASQILRSHGYLRGNVTYEVISQKNDKKVKVAYDVVPNHLFRIDSLSYIGFPDREKRLLETRASQSLLHKGDAFDVTNLEAERERIGRLFRNQGLFYYQSIYASYLADTLSAPNKVWVKLQLADSLPQLAMRKWYIGKANLVLKRNYTDEATDSIVSNRFNVHFSGKKPPIRSRDVLKHIRLFPGRAYRYNDYLESISKLNETGLYSSVELNLVPRDTTQNSDTLDMQINCMLDKKYDFYLEANVKGKTSGRLGPGMVLGFAKRNAFRGGEILEFNLNGNYEWEMGNYSNSSRSGFNSYEYGGNVSLKLPRLLLPIVKKRYLFRPPLSIIKFSSDIVNRAGYFKRHIVSGELTFTWQTSGMSKFEFSPFILQFDYMTKSSNKFKEIIEQSPYLRYSMQDKFIPKTYYSYTYTSPSFFLNPIRFQVSLSEAGNLLSLGQLALGKSWKEKDKKIFKNPYAQFSKIEIDFTKTWKTTSKSALVAHLNSGIVWSYGNSIMAPYSEQFYVGGANSIRAFNIRTIGPGSYHVEQSKNSYLDQTGDIKFLANLEYRPHLLGNLYGALFVDAGNVWTMKDDYRAGSKFQARNIFNQMALGTGIGIRYDMQFLVIRVDWGAALHTPYNKGFYNIKSFKEAQTLHFAIGYPF